MPYLSVLEKIESGQLTVSQGIKEIERIQKIKVRNARKIKLLIKRQDKNIPIPAVSLKLVKPFFKICAPFITFDEKSLGNEFNKEEMNQLLRRLEMVVQLMADHPPVEILKLKSGDTTIRVITL